MFAERDKKRGREREREGSLDYSSSGFFSRLLILTSNYEHTVATLLSSALSISIIGSSINVLRQIPIKNKYIIYLIIIIIIIIYLINIYILIYIN